MTESANGLPNLIIDNGNPIEIFMNFYPFSTNRLINNDIITSY